MGVYVYDMEAPYRGMKMCHMAADLAEDLLAMADRIAEYSEIGNSTQEQPKSTSTFVCLSVLLQFKTERLN